MPRIYIETTIRKGECTPDKCETSDGKVGVACGCKNASQLGGIRCPHLQDDLKCELHDGLEKATDYGFKRKDKPTNCSDFPSSPVALMGIKNCGFYFVKEITTENGTTTGERVSYG